MKSLSKLALAMTFAGVLSGCASLMDEDFQDIVVTLSCNEKPLKAQCVAKNGQGRWAFNAPGSVQVKNEYGDLEITCKLPYTYPFTVSAPALPSWTLAGNLLLGGLVGAAYDVHNNTGLKYPETINITSPTCKSLP
jgi:hypothetical protein